MSRDTPRCRWCHRTEGDVAEVRVAMLNFRENRAREVNVPVHPEHEGQTRRYFEKVRRFSRVFLYSVLLACAAPFVFLAFRWRPGIGASLVYLGLVMWFFPFATPTTVELLGIRNSVRLARAFGVVFILGGTLLLAL